MLRTTRIILFCLYFLAGFSLQSQAPSRLSTLDSAYTSQPTLDIDPVIATAYTPELQAASSPSLVSALKLHASLIDANSSTAKTPITSLSIAEAFNAWVGMIGASAASYATPSDVSAERIFLSHFAHHLFPRATNSAVHHDLSPAEAVYLLDRMIAQGGCPHRTSKDIASGGYSYDPSTDKNLAAYRVSVQAYYDSKTDAARLANFLQVLQRAHLM